MKKLFLSFIFINVVFANVDSKSIENFLDNKNIKDKIISLMIEKTLDPMLDIQTQEDVFSGLSFIPIVSGFSTMVLDDIQYKKLLNKIDEEKKILDLKIDINKEKITEMNKLLNKNKMDFVTLIDEITDIKKYITESNKDIRDIKNGIFIHALNSLKKYVNNSELDDISRRDFLNRALDSFEMSNTIQNTKLFNLSNYYLIYINNEFYNLTKSNLYIEDISKSFKKLALLVQKNEINLKLLNVSYTTINHLKGYKLNEFREILRNVTEKFIMKTIKDKNFEKALILGRDYQNITNEEVLFKLAKKLRIENSKNSMQNFVSSETVFKLIEENNNNLLNAEAVRYLFFTNGSLDKAIEVLKTKSFDNNFRVKAFKSIAKYEKNEDKLTKINNLIKKYSELYSDIK